jgi:hypothetical protein
MQCSVFLDPGFSTLADEKSEQIKFARVVSHQDPKITTYILINNPVDSKIAYCIWKNVGKL